MATIDQSSKSYDYVIIGAGSAGCVLANRLSADPGTRVLVLEAGAKDKSWLIHVPLGVGKVWHTPQFNWSYMSDPEPHLGGRQIFHPRGKVVGGSSSINMMAYVRGHRADYDRWRQFGLDGWSYDDVLPYFKRSETFEGPRQGVSRHGRPAAHADDKDRRSRDRCVPRSGEIRRLRADRRL